MKRIAVKAVAEISKHSEVTASKVVDEKAVGFLAALISHSDTSIKRNVCKSLSHIASHSIDLAEHVVEAEIFPRIFNCLKDGDVEIRKNAASCICEISKHSADLAKMITHAGGVIYMVEFCNNSSEADIAPGITGLGYLGKEESLAMQVIANQGVQPIKQVLLSSRNIDLLVIAARSLSELGKHSPDHAKALAEHGVLTALLQIYLNKSLTNKTADDEE